MTRLDEGWLHERWPDSRNASGITRLELVSGWVTGLDPRAPDINEVDPMRDPVAALEHALLPAVQCQPCCVAFSGGCDSSVLLAAATRVARREGLPEPVPITQRWPDIEESQEEPWQHELIKYLGLRDWEIIEYDDDMDLLGEVAASVLREFGLLWPPASHGLLPMQRIAAGGVLIQGDGGDQVFGGWRRVHLAALLGGRRRAKWKDARRGAAALTPFPLRARVEGMRAASVSPWLRDPVMAVWRRHVGRSLAREPVTWPAFLQWTRRERPTVLMLETWDRLGRSVGAQLSTPFWDSTFLRSLAVWGGRFGAGSRTAVMTALFSSFLPDGYTRRRTKARLTRAYCSRPSRQFAETWAGPLPEEDLVDRAVLRDAWLSDFMPTTSAPLLQASWLLGQ